MDDPSTITVTEGFGLMFYREASLWDNARWYDPALGRFAQADTIVPGGVQGLDRYAYGLNDPSRTDPDGHRPCDLVREGDIIDWNEAKKGSAWYGEWDIKETESERKES